MQCLHSFARRAFLGNFDNGLASDPEPDPGLLRQVQFFNQQIAPPLGPGDAGAALGGRCRPVTGFDKNDTVLPVRPCLARAAEIAGDSLALDQLRPVEHLHRAERPVVACYSGNASHCYPSFAIAAAVSTMRLEKPHSLSYQLSTRTSLPSITAVSRLSTVELALVCMRSIETKGSSV